jgi:chromosome segregation ATPase
LQLDAALITVSIRPETEVKVEITSAEETGSKSLAQDDTHQIKGAPEVAFRIPGLGKFLATGPTGDFDELSGQWESAVAKFEELTAGFGTGDVAALEKLRAEADELDKQISQAAVKVETILDGESIDDLRGRRSRAASTLDEILREHPQWKDAPPDPAEISRQADETEQRFTSDIDDAEGANDRAQNALRLAMEKQSSHQAEIDRQEVQAAAIDRRLESLRSDGMDDKQRTDNLTQIALRRDTAQGKLRQVDEKIQQLGDDPSKSLAVLEGQLEAFRAEAADAAKKLNTESGRLEQIIAEAPYSALAAVEEEISGLEDEVARHRLQIDAIRLLHDTLVAQKRDVMQTILDPIRRRANLILQRIAGARFDDITFDESLLPSGIAPKSVDQSVALHHISGGEQEQVYFAVRMALADVAFNNQRQLVVLDDVFTYTDTTRLARIATILDEAAERFQIVLLTCHPERYRGLPNAKFFDLEEIAASHATHEPGT